MVGESLNEPMADIRKIIETADEVNMTQSIMTEIGSGELIDKITILEIKSERIEDVDKLKNVKHELSVLSATRDAHLSGIDGLTIWLHS